MYFTELFSGIFVFSLFFVFSMTNWNLPSVSAHLRLNNDFPVLLHSSRDKANILGILCKIFSYVEAFSVFLYFININCVLILDCKFLVFSSPGAEFGR